MYVGTVRGLYRVLEMSISGSVCGVGFGVAVIEFVVFLSELVSFCFFFSLWSRLFSGFRF